MLAGTPIVKLYSTGTEAGVMVAEEVYVGFLGEGGHLVVLGWLEELVGDQRLVLDEIIKCLGGCHRCE